MNAAIPAQPGAPPPDGPAARDARSQKPGLATPPDASMPERGTDGDESQPEPSDGDDFEPL